MRARLLVLSLVLVLVAPQFARPQVTVNPASTDSSATPLISTEQWHNPQENTLTRVGAVLGASAIFSFADYVGFNAVKQHAMNHGEAVGNYRAPVWFRIAEGTLQAALSYLLYQFVDLSSAVSFNLMWWTWCDDFAYYAWGYTTGLYPWESSLESGLRFSEYASAGWTPIGLTRRQGAPIAKSTLLAQAAVGLAISLALLW